MLKNRFIKKIDEIYHSILPILAKIYKLKIHKAIETLWI